MIGIVIIGVWVVRKRRLQNFHARLVDREQMTRSDAIALNSGGKARGDAAIICVAHDRNWVLSSLLQELKKASQWKDFGESKYKNIRAASEKMRPQQ